MGRGHTRRSALHRRRLRCPPPPPQALVSRGLAGKQAYIKAELLREAERIIRWVRTAGGWVGLATPALRPAPRCGIEQRRLRIIVIMPPSPHSPSPAGQTAPTWPSAATTPSSCRPRRRPPPQRGSAASLARRRRGREAPGRVPHGASLLYSRISTICSLGNHTPMSVTVRGVQAGSLIVTAPLRPLPPQRCREHITARPAFSNIPPDERLCASSQPAAEPSILLPHAKPLAQAPPAVEDR